jgi:hypothetical protein
MGDGFAMRQKQDMIMQFSIREELASSPNTKSHGNKKKP